MSNRYDLSNCRRRQHLLEPGEHLVLAHDPVGAMARFGAFGAFAGIAAGDLVASPMCAATLPAYPSRWPEGRRRWAGTRPEALWHPLLWLPERLASRYMIDLDDGESTVEPTDLWATRIALEMDASGIYDPASGTWLDVMSLIGMDLDRPGDVERARRWLDGAPDPDLDRIDLAEMFDDPSDPDWALYSAADMLDGLYALAWAMGANALLADLAGLLDDMESGAVDASAAAQAVAAVAMSGRGWMANIPPGEPDDSQPRSEDEWWAAALDAAESNRDDINALRSWVVPNMVRYIAGIRDSFWPYLVDHVNEAWPGGALPELVPVPVPA